MLKDQKDLLSCFNAHGVEYVVVGGYAVNAHGVPRVTRDVDVLIRPEAPNSERVFAALAEFGAPVSGMTEAEFRDNPEQIVQIGVEPSRIDLLQQIGTEAVPLPFEQVWRNRVRARIDAELVAPFISREDLIRSKEGTARLRDQADVQELRELDRVRKKRKKRLGIPGTLELLGPESDEQL